MCQKDYNMPYHDIKFDDDTVYKSHVILGEPKTLKLLIFIQNHSGGMIRNSKQAGYVILIFVGLVLAVSILLFLKNPGSAHPDLISAPVPVGGYQGLPESGKSYPTLIPKN